MQITMKYGKKGLPVELPFLTEAIRKSVKGKNDRCAAVVPEGPYVIPLYRPEDGPPEGVRRVVAFLKVWKDG